MSVSHMNSHSGAPGRDRKSAHSLLRPVLMFGPDSSASTASTGVAPSRHKPSSDAQNSARTLAAVDVADDRPVTTHYLVFR